MSKNLRKFTSNEAYNQYKATDGWDYPSVCFVQTNTQYEVHYNKEFIMRWYDSDVTKVPTFLGDISRDEFRNWVDHASKPCEIKKDGSDFAYLKMNANGIDMADFTKRSDDTASHYDTVDKTDYLQMTEIQNVNVGLFENQIEGWKEVRFNWDSGCPAGFHKWFPNSKSGTKLIGRYDSIPAGSSVSDTSSGINCCKGVSMGVATDSVWAKGNWRADYLLAATKATPTNNSISLLEETYWEHVVLTYIYCAYFGTFNTQGATTDSTYGTLTDYRGNSANYSGRYNGSTGNAGNIETGVTDTILKHCGSLGNNSGYRFMHIEDAIHGKQWIWCAGWKGNTQTTGGSYYMTYDDILANTSASDWDTSKAEVKGVYPYNANSTYISAIDLWQVPTSLTASSSTTGFYDGWWSFYTGSGRVAYVGGVSFSGALDGGFARAFFNVASDSGWVRRGRSTMNH